MAKAGFGDHLRREREMRAVSLDEICASTRISTRFLEALENEDWRRLPGGVFNRGFVRAASRYLGLNEDEMVAEYVLAVERPPAADLSSNVTAKPGTKWRLLWISAAALLLLAFAGWVGWRFH